ncbi:hypothetical protein [Catenibacterium mitsuokai]|uniref:hypothetical protein n=2 Tax=Catenibacterium mitsuokai TaxID=100886 RepID=UPI003F8AFA31
MNYMKKIKKADVIVAIIIFYVIVAVGYTIITGVGTFVADLIDGQTHYYLLYSWKNTEVEKKFQKKYVPEIEEYIQTSDLPDITVTVDRCSYTEYSKSFYVPEYELYVTYSSQVIDDYYDSAIKSKRGAKELLNMMLEVHKKKNEYYENRSKIYWFGEPFQSDGRIVSLQDYDYILELSGKKHKYMIENEIDVDRLTIDDKVVYERNNSESSYYNYTPSEPKNYYPSIELPGSSNTYNDGYNSAIDDGDYDHDRYRNDSSYRQGVDDGFDEVDEDY